MQPCNSSERECYLKALEDRIADRYIQCLPPCNHLTYDIQKVKSSFTEFVEHYQSF